MQKNFSQSRYIADPDSDMSAPDFEEFDKFVIKRSGRREPLDYSKVDEHLNKLNSYPYQLSCNASFVAQKVRNTITSGITTRELDEFASKTATDFAMYDTDFQILAARIAISNHQKNTRDCFSECVKACYENYKTVKSKKPQHAPRVNSIFYKFVQCHRNELNKMVDYDRDYNFSYFGFTTLIDRYLIKRSGDEKKMKTRPQDFVIERPQDMWMRVACAIWMNRNNIQDATVLPKIRELYDLLSMGKLMLATPTLYNMGTNREQALSCFLFGGADSMEGITKLKSDCMITSKYSGGIGFWWDLRANGAEVRSTNGVSNGPIPFLAAMAKDLEASNQGGKRSGSGASYMEPTHPDFMRWIRLCRSDEPGCIDTLFYGAFIPDLFMEYVRDNKMWYFMDPDDHPDLYRLYGEQFKHRYEEIVRDEGYVGEPVEARKIMIELARSQIQTGMPYLLYKDHINNKTAYQEYMTRPDKVGLIKCSNLCAEIVEYSDTEEYACCVLGTLCVNKYIRNGSDGEPVYNWDELEYNAGVLCETLNRIIDINFYPVPETKHSNEIHRPLAIGIQGLADAFILMDNSFTSQTSRYINQRIMETIYYGALRRSCDLAREYGPCESFEGSPFSQGKFQFDLWLDAHPHMHQGFKLCMPEKWEALRADVMRWGVRNLQLTSLPPTASTSHIQGNNECHEPFMNNIVARKTLSGEFIIINEYLVRDLKRLGLWNARTRGLLIKNRGSVKSIDFLPPEIREKYQTVWEYETRDLIDMDAERAPFVDQTMSSNRFMLNPDPKRIIAMHVHAWNRGLKTSMYYLRSQSNSKARQFAGMNEVNEVNEVKKPVEQPEQPVHELIPETKEPTTDDIISEMTCEMKKINGVICYSCQ